MKIKLKILIMTNVIFSLFWFAQIFSYDYLLGFAMNSGSIVFPFLMVFFLVYSSIYSYKLLNNKLKQNIQERPKISLMALLSVAPNFIGTVLYIFVNDELLNLRISNPDLIDKEKKKKKAFDPKLRRLDIMFKLGTLLVLIAGVLFAFSSDAPGSARTLVSLAFAIIYLIVSKYLEKLKIHTSAKLYWFLAMGFFLLSFISIGYIELFGNWYSFFGEGALVFVGGCFTIFALLSFLSYFNFKDERYLFGLYAGLLGLGISLCRFFALTVEETLITILPIFVILSIFSRNSKIFKSKVLFEFTNMTVVAMILTFFINMFTLENRLAVYLLSIFFVTYINLMILKNKESDLRYFGTILSYCVFIPSIIGQISVGTFALATALFAIISYGISYLYKSLEIRAASLTSANILLILAFIISLAGENLSSIIISIIAITLSLLVNILDSDLDYEFKFELYSHPIKIAMFIYAVLGLKFLSMIPKLESFIVLTLVFYVLAYSLVKSDVMNKIYKIASIIVLAIVFQVLSEFSSILLVLLSLSAMFIYYANVYWKKKEATTFINILYIFMLVFIYKSTYALDELLHFGLYDSYVYANIISLLMFLGIALFHKKDKNKYNIALFVAILPMMALMDVVQNAELFAILGSLLILYAFFVLSLFNFKDKTKKIMKEIATVLALALVVFDGGIYTFVYTMVLSILILVLSYSKENGETLFKIAIISMVLSLIYRLKEYIFAGPLYLYILIAGLALIVFVTVKQLKHDKELKEKEDNDESKR